VSLALVDECVPIDRREVDSSNVRVRPNGTSSDKGASSDRWEVDSSNMPARPSRTSSCQRGCVGRSKGSRFTEYASKT
jgi:hypothetical protein